MVRVSRAISFLFFKVVRETRTMAQEEKNKE